MKYFRILLLLVILLVLISCGDEPEQPVTKPPFQIQSVNSLPEFNSDNALMNVEKQLSFGPRNPNSDGHRKALFFLQNELMKYADKVELQPFTYTGYEGEKLALTNIVAKFNPDAKNRIIICAHWDTRPRADAEMDSLQINKPILGANDGGSGTAVILELARIIKTQKPSYGIDLILFDGEDYGKKDDLDYFLLGSKYFAANLPVGYQPSFAVLLDLVGDKDAMFFKEALSMRYAPDIVNMVWRIANEVNANKFVDMRTDGVYDDHVPLNLAGIKAINIVDAELVGNKSSDERRKYWHTRRDNMQNISKETLQQVGDVLVKLIYSLHFNT